MLSVTVDLFHTDYRENGLFEFSCNSQTSFFTSTPIFGQEVIWFYLEAFGQSGAKAYMIPNYSSLAHTQMVKSLQFIKNLNFFELPFHV